jgi:hypothetical protein
MDYLQASKHFDLNKMLLNQKGKSLAEIAVFLFHEGRSAESRSISGSNEVNKMHGNYVAAVGRLHYAFSRGEVAKLPALYGVHHAYRELISDLVERGELSPDAILALN